ncbi:DUF6207 family protein [Streptomyces sp. NPDC048483]|uniref:DUF6207 family protein n=1 Tax=Streptomyces sp. NPDC048483 TaxID=3154927 RepID=UPI003419DDFB
MKISEGHVGEPGLVVVDITAVDDETANPALRVHSERAGVEVDRVLPTRVGVLQRPRPHARGILCPRRILGSP